MGSECKIGFGGTGVVALGVWLIHVLVVVVGLWLGAAGSLRGEVLFECFSELAFDWILTVGIDFALLLFSFPVSISSLTIFFLGEFWNVRVSLKKQDTWYRFSAEHIGQWLHAGFVY